MSKYSPRLVDDILIKELRAFGAVCITGPKYCGKTTSAERISASTLRMQDRSENDRNLILAKINPQLLLEGDKPRLIDEWQIAPQLWDAIRVNVDSSGETGQFILTGSVNVDGKNIHHSGTGRIDTLVMSTFSLFESEDSNGCVSLKDLCDKKRGISGTSNKELKDVAKIITRGGWSPCDTPHMLEKLSFDGENAINTYHF